MSLMAHAQFANRSPAASKPRLNAPQLAVVINEEQPESVELGEFYRTARGIPEQNIIRVRIPGRSHVMTAPDFARLKAQIDAQLPANINAVLFVWTAPYAVECNSLTAAFTLGFQPDLCKKTCNPSTPNPYFDANPKLSVADSGLRLSMLLPTDSIEQGKALIERGLRSDGSWPTGSAYFLKTSDPVRNSRAPFFPKNAQLATPPLTLKTISADRLEGEQDVMFYFTGSARVAGLETLKFLPGSVADHLTSAGGDLLGTGQMSSLRWLEAGATGSYGTVSEPCNHWQKFPNPAVLLKHYVNGNTLIEAYWKSVAWPAQGIFIGEPLAAPYSGRPSWQLR